jgi:hypothetical protein
MIDFTIDTRIARSPEDVFDERGRAFGLRVVEGSLPVDLDVAFVPSDGGTLMRFRGHGKATGAMRLAQPLLQRVLRRQFGEQCATLKRVMEGAG